MTGYCRKLFHRASRRRVLAVLLSLFFGVFAAGPASAIQVERVKTPRGLEVWLVRDHTIPVISMRFVFRGGAALDPAGKEGLAEMVSSLLDEGAGDLDSQAFQRKLESQAIKLMFSAGRDTFGGRLKTLRENRGQAFELLRLAVTSPRFDAEPVSRIRSQILAGLRRGSEDPDIVASRKLMRVLYPSHPYGRPVQGTPESVNAITASDLKNFVKQRFARNNLMIGIVGDISVNETAALVDSVFGELRAKAASWKVPEIQPSDSGKTFVVNKPVPQSSIMFAHEGFKRDDPDFYAAYVVNYILGGGGFTSRLYNEVREKRGLAYSIYSRLQPLDYSALIVGTAGTANQRVGETLTVLRKEWRRLADEGVAAQELSEAKTYLTGSFPLRFTSSGRIAGTLVGMQLNNLGIDYLDRRNSFIEAVTLKDANRVAKRLLHGEKLTVVVVGRPNNVTSTE